MSSTNKGEIKVVPVSAIQDRISNVREVLRFKTNEYMSKCTSARAYISQCSYRQMATNAGSYFPDLQKIYAEITALDELIDNLQVIIDNDAVLVQELEGAE